MQVVSLSCAVHCIILPLLMVASPLLGHMFDNHMVELGLLLFSISCGVYVVYQGYCIHKKTRSLYLFGLGALIWLVHGKLTHHELMADVILLLIGSIFVLIAYYVNHRLIKACSCEHCD